MLAFAWLAAPGVSVAHFVLTSPPAMYEQDQLGDPQKAPPCGNHMDMAVPTGEVTAVQAGDTITVTIDETVYHPGHYRIALALDDGIFPEPPPVTPGDTPCGSAPIDPAPAFPVLADGVWVHTEPMQGPQSIEVTIPEDVSCTNCTLQIIQFMSNHGLNNPGGCYYHHCATISVEPAIGPGETGPGDDTGGASSGGPADTTATDDDGSGQTGDVPGGGDGSTGTATGASSGTDTVLLPGDDEAASGCGCSAPAGGTTHAFGMLVGLLGLAGLRRGRRRP